MNHSTISGLSTVSLVVPRVKDGLYGPINPPKSKNSSYQSLMTEEATTVSPLLTSVGGTVAARPTVHRPSRTSLGVDDAVLGYAGGNRWRRTSHSFVQQPSQISANSSGNSLNSLEVPPPGALMGSSRKQTSVSTSMLASNRIGEEIREEDEFTADFGNGNASALVRKSTKTSRVYPMYSETDLDQVKNDTSTESWNESPLNHDQQQRPSITPFTSKRQSKNLAAVNYPLPNPPPLSSQPSQPSVSFSSITPSMNHRPSIQTVAPRGSIWARESFSFGAPPINSDVSRPESLLEDEIQSFFKPRMNSVFSNEPNSARGRHRPSVSQGRSRQYSRDVRSASSGGRFHPIENATAGPISGMETSAGAIAARAIQGTDKSAVGAISQPATSISNFSVITNSTQIPPVTARGSIWARESFSFGAPTVPQSRTHSVLEDEIQNYYKPRHESISIQNQASLAAPGRNSLAAAAKPDRGTRTGSQATVISWFSVQSQHARNASKMEPNVEEEDYEASEVILHMVEKPDFQESSNKRGATKIPRQERRKTGPAIGAQNTTTIKESSAEDQKSDTGHQAVPSQIILTRTPSVMKSLRKTITHKKFEDDTEPTEFEAPGLWTDIVWKLRGMFVSLHLVFYDPEDEVKYSEWKHKSFMFTYRMTALFLIGSSILNTFIDLAT
jgi:hypothetical protein